MEFKFSRCREHKPENLSTSMFDMKFDFTVEQQDKIKKLRELVERNTELCIGTEDVLLAKFLYYTKWQVDRANECIQRYYDFKMRHPDWVACHSVAHFREQLFYTASKFVMPKPDKDGRTIVVFKAFDAFNRYPNYLHDIIEMDDLIFESLLLIQSVQRLGITIIVDLAGSTKSFIRLLSPAIARLINEKNEILPFTSRTIHIIQKGFFMNTAAAMLLPLMSKEIKERIVTHDGKNFDKLRDMIGYDSLPAEYGGPIENVLDVNFIYNHLLKSADYLLKLQSYRKIII